MLQSVIKKCLLVISVLAISGLVSAGRVYAADTVYAIYTPTSSSAGYYTVVLPITNPATEFDIVIDLSQMMSNAGPGFTRTADIRIVNETGYDYTVEGFTLNAFSGFKLYRPYNSAYNADPGIFGLPGDDWWAACDAFYTAKYGVGWTDNLVAVKEFFTVVVTPSSNTDVPAGVYQLWQKFIRESTYLTLNRNTFPVNGASMHLGVPTYSGVPRQYFTMEAYHSRAAYDYFSAPADYAAWLAWVEGCLSSQNSKIVDGTNTYAIAWAASGLDITNSWQGPDSGLPVPNMPFILNLKRGDKQDDDDWLHEIRKWAMVNGDPIGLADETVDIHNGELFAMAYFDGVTIPGTLEYVGYHLSNDFDPNEIHLGNPSFYASLIDGDITITYFFKLQGDPRVVVPYTVEYYFNGVLDPTLTFTGAGESGYSINTFLNKGKTGYTLDHVEGLPLVLDDDPSLNVIRVYYVLASKPPRTGDNVSWLLFLPLLLSVAGCYFSLKHKKRYSA